MKDHRRITIRIPADELAAAQAHTGTGISETVRRALKELADLQRAREAASQGQPKGRD